MNSTLWFTTSPEALGKISDTEDPRGWDTALQSWMKMDERLRMSSLDIFAAVAIRVENDRIELLWLPRLLWHDALPHCLR